MICLCVVSCHRKNSVSGAESISWFSTSRCLFFGKEKVYNVSSCFLSMLFMDEGSDFAVSWLLDELFNNKVFALSSYAKSYFDS